MFDRRRSWKRTKDLLGVDRQQALKPMLIKKDVLHLLDIRFPSDKQVHPKVDRMSCGKFDDDDDDDDIMSHAKLGEVTICK